jgi:hypothetical protein
MNTVLNNAGKSVIAVLAAIGFTVAAVLGLDVADASRPLDPVAVEARMASDPAVQAFLGVPKSYKRSVNKTTDEFVAGWAEGLADQNPVVRMLGALTERQVEFIRAEIAPRVNYIEENNPPRIASEQFSAHTPAIGRLVFAAR